jgi:hypothetical protein
MTRSGHNYDIQGLVISHLRDSSFRDDVPSIEHIVRVKQLRSTQLFSQTLMLCCHMCDSETQTLAMTSLTSDVVFVS